MTKNKEIIGFDEDYFLSALIKNKDKNIKEIYKILSKTGEKIDITELFGEEHGEPFALYHLPKTTSQNKGDGTHSIGNIHYTHPERYIGYSYGEKYNRQSNPKTFFLERAGEILQCNFLGKNIIISPVKEKNAGRDSYYPNNYQYITEFDAKTILEKIVEKGEYKLIIGAPFVKRDYGSIDAMEVFNEAHQFAAKTRFHGSHMYYPIQEITKENLLSDSFPIDEIVQTCLSRQENTISSSNLEKIQKIRYRDA